MTMVMMMMMKMMVGGDDDDVVGLNCGREPHTILPLLREAGKVCKGE